MRTTVHARLRMLERFAVPYEKAAADLEDIARQIRSGEAEKVERALLEPIPGTDVWKARLPSGRTVYALCRGGAIMTVLTEGHVRFAERSKRIRRQKARENRAVQNQLTQRYAGG